MKIVPTVQIARANDTNEDEYGTLYAIMLSYEQVEREGQPELLFLTLCSLLRCYVTQNFVQVVSLSKYAQLLHLADVLS